MRRSAKDASIYINGVKIAQAHNVTVNVSPEFIESKGFGDNFKQRVPDGADWTVDAERFSLVGGALGYFLDGVMTQTTSADPSPLTLTVYQKDGDASTKLIEGPVWFGETSIEMSRGSLVGEKGAFVAESDPTYWIGM